MLLSLGCHSKLTRLKECDKIWAEFLCFDVYSPWKTAVRRDDVFLTFFFLSAHRYRLQVKPVNVGGGGGGGVSPQFARKQNKNCDFKSRRSWLLMWDVPCISANWMKTSYDDCCTFFLFLSFHEAPPSSCDFIFKPMPTAKSATYGRLNI